MAGRLAWILAGGAAIVGGMAIQGSSIIDFDSGEHEERVVKEAIAEAKAERIADRVVRTEVIDSEGGRAEADADRIESINDAVADLVKAEAALAVAQMGSNPNPEEVRLARVERDEAQARVDRLNREVSEEAASGGVDAGRDAVRDQIRDNVRQEVREAIRNN